jgi:hypothetical protein
VNTRIRYGREDESGSMESRRVFTTADGQPVKVTLNTTLKSFEVRNVLSGEVLVSEMGKTKNQSVLKIRAKDALRTLGCDFSEEDRTPRKDRHGSGYSATT